MRKVLLICGVLSPVLYAVSDMLAGILVWISIVVRRAGSHAAPQPVEPDGGRQVVRKEEMNPQQASPMNPDL